MRWLKLDSGIYRNPKIVRAGRDARDLFIYLLCLNAEQEFNGEIPSGYADPEYLARDMGMEPEAVGHALVTLCHACLVTKCDSGHVTISGWGAEWAPAPRTDRERKREQRKRERNARNDSGCHGNVTDSHALSRCHVEERRGEEKREEEIGPLAGAIERLWAYQNELRSSAVPGSRQLRLTKDASAAVAKILKSGHSEDDCRTVLESYAAEARRKPDSARWFNGETNWRPDNFRRTLGQAGAKNAKSSAERAMDDLLARKGLQS